MNPKNFNRRDFIQGVSAAGLILAAGRGRAQSPSEKITVAVMGVRGRGRFHADYLASRKDAEIAYLCDVDEGVLNATAQSVEKISGKRPKTVGDFRRILEDKDVNAIFIATPDHWHSLATIMACQAGKDVYVEKPVSHSPFEGRKMVEAARKYNRIVQVGMQTRSGEYTAKAMEYIKSGKLGKIHLVRVYSMKQSGSIGRRPDGEAPKGVDYDMWLGPAPKRPYNPNQFHYGWNYFWNYSGGELINDGIHQIDIARMFMEKDYPKSVVATGGKFALPDDDQETPDTLQVAVAFDDLTMSIEIGTWMPYQTKVPNDARESTTYYPNWPFCGERLELYGTQGEMLFGRHGIGWQVFAGPEAKVIADGNGPVPLIEHVDNFFSCIKSRKLPTADIEEGHRSTLIAELANISYRVGGRKLDFDGAAEGIVNDEEAQKLMRRAYREPWVVGDVV